MQATYLLLSVLGTLVPLSQFVPWLVKNGLAVPLLLQQAFWSPISAFAWADVLVSAVVVVVFIRTEGRRLRMSSLWASCRALRGRCLTRIAAIPFHAQSAILPGRPE